MRTVLIAIDLILVFAFVFIGTIWVLLMAFQNREERGLMILIGLSCFAITALCVCAALKLGGII